MVNAVRKRALPGLILLWACLFLIGSGLASDGYLPQSVKAAQPLAFFLPPATFPKEAKRIPLSSKAAPYRPQSNPPDRQYLILIQCVRTEYQHLGKEITIQHSYHDMEICNGDILTLTEEQVRIETRITEDDEKTPDTGGGYVVFDIGPGTGTISQTLRIRVDEEGSSRYHDAYAVWEITYTLTPVVP